MSKLAMAAPAVTFLAIALPLTACSGPPQEGTVTGWKWSPPSVQTVDTQCDLWSGTGGKNSNSGSSYCLSWNTKTEPFPQVCTLRLSSGATLKLAISERACKAMLGTQWPVGGGDMG